MVERQYRIDGTGLITNPYAVYKRLWLFPIWRPVVYRHTFEEAEMALSDLIGAARSEPLPLQRVE